MFLGKNKSKQELVYRKDYEKSQWLIPRVELTFDLHSTTTSVLARYHIESNPDYDKAPMLHSKDKKSRELFLDGVGLTLRTIRVNDELLPEKSYTKTSKGLLIHNFPSEGVLEHEVILNPSENKSFIGLYQSNGIFCTQCEAQGFRRIVYFIDRPDILSVYTVKIRYDAKKYSQALSNGNFVSKKNLQAMSEVTWHDSDPKPCYLFALVAGNLDVISDKFITKDDRTVALNIYTERGKAKYAKWAMKSLKKAFLWDEDKFSRIYGLDMFNVVAVSDFNFGAMENKSLNIFNESCILADSKTATDSDFATIERVIAHEYFHEWTGNRITLKDWFQLSLKEGLTVYREQEFGYDVHNSPAERLRDIEGIKSGQFLEDRGPLKHPVRPESYSEINNFYTTTIYNKGAEVIRMISRITGLELFHSSLDLYFKRYDGMAIDLEDMISCFEEVCQRSFKQFMLWYSKAGTPAIKVRLLNEEGQKLKIVLIQQLKDKDEAWLIPLDFAIFDKVSKKLVYKARLICNKDKQSYTLNIPYSNTDYCLSFNRGFTAPVNIEVDTDLKFIAKYESDSYSRWNACLEMFRKLFLEVYLDKYEKEVTKFHAYSDLKDVFITILLDESLSDEIKAMLLNIPSDSYLQETILLINPSKYVSAKDMIIAQLAKDLRDQFLASFIKISLPKNYHFIPSDVGARSFRGVLLKYLSKTDNKIVRDSYSSANNMTEVMSCLFLLADNEDNEDLMQDFKEKWQSNPLVFDKYLAARGRSSRNDTYEIVSNIVKSKSIDLNNPNRVISLSMNFANNIKNFHRIDFKGYDFIYDMILLKDPVNPQTSAYLAKIFSQWQKYAKPWAGKQKERIINLSQNSNISNDLSEVVSTLLIK